MTYPDAPRPIAAIARRNHGIVTVDQLRRFLSPREIEGWVRKGHLTRLHRGVYALAGAPPTPQQRLLAAVRAVAPPAGASHRSAAALWKLITDFPVTPEIVVPVRRYARIPGVLVHRSVDLQPAHILERQTIPVTNPLVTILALGAVEPADVVADAINRGAALRLFRPVAIEAAVARHSRPGRDGLTTVRDALALLPDSRRPSDGVLELQFARIARTYGIEGYEFQHPIRGERIRIDFAFPDVRLAIEVDDYETHGTPMGFVHDRERQNRLVVLGWTVLRFTWHDLTRRPAVVARQINDVLRALRHPLSA
jgi:very-short-patch-repair endonuclease